MRLPGDNSLVALRKRERVRERGKKMKARGKRRSKKFKDHVSKGGGEYSYQILKCIIKS